MKLSLVAAIAVTVVALMSQPARALDNCYVVTATADARNPQVSTQRAENRLHRHIADELRSSTGKTVGPVTTQCIRNACKARAVVCQH